MDLSTLVELAYNHFTPILGAMTCISFCYNIIQSRNINSKIKTIQSHLDSIYITCTRTQDVADLKGHENVDFYHTISTIRDITVSSLNFIGIKRIYGLSQYGSYDEFLGRENGPLFSPFARIFRLLIFIKIRFPYLFKSNEKILEDYPQYHPKKYKEKSRLNRNNKREKKVQDFGQKRKSQDVV